MTGIMEIKKQCQLNQWNAMVQSQEDSGLNVREYCRRNGIKPSTYYYRLRRLRLETIQMQNEPQIVEFTPPVSETNENINNIIIKTDNTIVEIPINANPDTVSAAVSFLRLS